MLNSVEEVRRGHETCPVELPGEQSDLLVPHRPVRDEPSAAADRESRGAKDRPETRIFRRFQIDRVGGECGHGQHVRSDEPIRRRKRYDR